MKSERAIDLTTGHIAGNLWRLSLPIMFSNFMQTFYNLTDTWWLGKLSGDAQGAVATAGTTFPLIFFLSSFGFGFTIAGTAMVSRFKGAGENDKIEEVIGQFTFILIVFSALFVLISQLLVAPIVNALSVPVEIVPQTITYIRYIMIGLVFMFIFLLYQSIAHGLGDTWSPMIVQVVSVFVNIVLDPLLIFGVGFFPRLETTGAAIATMIARLIGATIAIYFMYKHSRHLLPSLSEIMPKWRIIKRILKLAIPGSVGHSITSFGFVMLQGFVNSFGTTIISAFSIGNCMIGLYMMPAMGIHNALAAIVGQNLGAKNVPRAQKTIETALIMVLSIMVVGVSIMYFFGADLTKFFIDSPDVIAVGRRMFKVVSFASLAFSIMFVFLGVFNGAGMTKTTMNLSIIRLWAIRIPLVYILSGHLLRMDFFRNSFLHGALQQLAQPLSKYPYDALWWSMIISNIASVIISFVIFRTGSWKHKKI
jgi:putative MATE family efflux protein